jgi:hypothetical protein
MSSRKIKDLLNFLKKCLRGAVQIRELSASTVVSLAILGVYAGKCNMIKDKDNIEEIMQKIIVFLMKIFWSR